MTEKIRARIDDLINLLPDGDKAIYRDLAMYAVGLGYSPIFHESVRRESESRKKIITVSEYSKIFQRKKDNCRLRKESCDKCRKCKSYYYTCSCGKVIECDHIYLIELPPIGAEHIDETRKRLRRFFSDVSPRNCGAVSWHIKKMMKVQHECWTHHL